jgi:hypothetical protein
VNTNPTERWRGMTTITARAPDFTIDIDEDAVVAGAVVTLQIGSRVFTSTLTSADILASAISCLAHQAPAPPLIEWNSARVSIFR